MSGLRATREALGVKKHLAGFVLPVRDGDRGKHWLRCEDCFAEWAEDDDGKLVEGSLLCVMNPAALAEVAAAEAVIQAARRMHAEAGGRKEASAWLELDDALAVLDRQEPA